MRSGALGPVAKAVVRSLIIAAAWLPAQGHAQPLQPGEAFVTRFSGTATSGSQGDEVVIDVEGTVGSIIDLRAPGQPPQGQHWIDEPQRRPVKASDIGQVFGVTLDGENPPNIYVTATAAFGLHRTSDNKDWMPGMWGPGGPGAVYKIDAKTGRPSVFAQITLAGRPNSGAALGNITYDRWNRQFFVSDLETGMIHRLGLDGKDLGTWDHGTQARENFLDPIDEQPSYLEVIPFDPASQARISDCPEGPFATTPACWNLAASGRRVWGLGVMRDAKRGLVRLYYSVWTTPEGNKGFAALPDDQKRNAVWSVALGADGSFAGDPRREFLLPDFFEAEEDIAGAGYSRPVSDITFPVCSDRGVMLVAERGGMRNLGLTEYNPFANPHEARLLRYELDHEGIWRPIGRYDVGFRERQPEDGPPTMQSNCAGGAAFGYGYDPSKWTIARNQPDQFVWTSGDSLCSTLGPCNAPGGEAADQPAAAAQKAKTKAKSKAKGAAPQPAAETTEGADSAGDVEVHGIQGIGESVFQPLGATAAPGTAPAPKGRPADRKAKAPSPQAAQGSTLNESYMIDTDINVDPTGKVDDQDTSTNDATMIGDVAIYQVCETAPLGFVPTPEPQPLAGGLGHAPQLSHSQYESHGRAGSHFRFGSHSPYVSHNRYQSHYRAVSHYRDGSHNRFWSHERRGSTHNRFATHMRFGSQHDRRLTHQRLGTVHQRILTHRRFGSPHDRRLTHQRQGSPHDRVMTHKRQGSPHDRRMTHERIGTPHSRALSHQRIASPHNRALSHERTGTPHNRAVSHKRIGSTHSRARTHAVSGSRVDDVPKKEHTRAMSHLRFQSKEQTIAPKQHQRPASPGHTPVQSHTRAGSPAHNATISHRREGSGQKRVPLVHNPAASHQRGGSAPNHSPVASHQRGGSAPKHSPMASHQRGGSAPGHSPMASQKRSGPAGTRQPAGGHVRALSQRREGRGR